MSDCYNSCNKTKSTKGGYIPPSALCGKNLNCKKVVKKELADAFLSNNEIAELSPIDTEIGLFTSGIDEIGFFSLHSESTAANDNDKFIIKDNKLKTKEILYYDPTVTYTVSVKYTSLKHYKQKDFIIVVTSSKDNITISTGQQVQVASTDNSIELIFDNVITAGEVTISPIEDPTVADILFYEIQNNSEIDGSTTISFNNENIGSDKNPAIYRIRYDSWLDEIFYENITTETIEGKITGVVNPVTSGFNAQTSNPCSGSCNYSFDQIKHAWQLSSNNCSGTDYGGTNCNCPSDFYVNSYGELGNGCKGAADCGDCVTLCGLPEDHKDPNRKDIYAIWIEPVANGIANFQERKEYTDRIMKDLYARGWVVPPQYTPPWEPSAGCPGAQFRPGFSFGASEFEAEWGLAGPCGCWEKPVTAQIIEGILNAFSFAGAARATSAQLIKTMSTASTAQQREDAAKQLPSAISQYVSHMVSAYEIHPNITIGNNPGFTAQSVYREKDCSNPDNLLGENPRPLINPVLREFSCKCCEACIDGAQFQLPVGFGVPGSKFEFLDISCDCECPGGGQSTKTLCKNQDTRQVGCYDECASDEIRTPNCGCAQIIQTCPGNCHYSFNWYFHEWQLVADNCTPINEEVCSCPDDNYVNNNVGDRNGCEDAADCADCVTNCQAPPQTPAPPG